MTRKSNTEKWAERLLLLKPPQADGLGRPKLGLRRQGWSRKYLQSKSELS